MRYKDFKYYMDIYGEKVIPALIKYVYIATSKEK